MLNHDMRLPIDLRSGAESGRGGPPLPGVATGEIGTDSMLERDDPSLPVVLHGLDGKLS